MGAAKRTFHVTRDLATLSAQGVLQWSTCFSSILREEKHFGNRSWRLSRTWTFKLNGLNGLNDAFINQKIWSKIAAWLAPYKRAELQRSAPRTTAAYLLAPIWFAPIWLGAPSDLASHLTCINLTYSPLTCTYQTCAQNFDPRRVRCQLYQPGVVQLATFRIWTSDWSTKLEWEKKVTSKNCLQ